MIGKAYSNILHIPMFGYGAKTLLKTGSSSGLFPISRDLRNPFVPNHHEIID